MDNLQALALGLKLHNVLFKMSKLSRDLCDMCNLDSAINLCFQTVTKWERIARKLANLVYQ